MSNFNAATDYSMISSDATTEVIIKLGANISLQQGQDLAKHLGISILDTYDPLSLQLWSMTADQIEEITASYGDWIEYLQPNVEFTVNAFPDDPPNDPHYNQLWGLDKIDAPEAWQKHQTNAKTIVAVIDTGVDYDHPDLRNNIWTNPGEIAGNGIDDDGNGYVDDVHGYDFANNDGDPDDDNGHGTHVAGTIAATGNNGIGVIGVAPNTEIIAVKFLNRSGSGSLFNAVKAINYVVDLKRNHGVNVQITNNSWGGISFYKPLFNAIAAAQDILFVAAAGNNGTNNDILPFYPASYNLDNLISVAATTPSDGKASFSNFGAQSVDLGAPGTSILSTRPGGEYRSLSGTSMASPHVAGVASLLLSQDPDLTIAQVKQIILDSVDPISALQGKTVSGGRLNANNALTQLLNSNDIGNEPVPTATYADFNGDNLADLVLRNQQTGENFLNFLDPVSNGTTSLGQVKVSLSANPIWVIGAIVDYDANGTPDILWRNEVDGRNAVWYFSGTTRTRGSLLPSHADTVWNLEAAADFDRNGTPDLLFRNPNTGENTLWLMAGEQRIRAINLPVTQNLAWDIVGVGDFNNDDNADILWQRHDTGVFALWRFNQDQYVLGEYLPNLSEASADWYARGVADFNQDGNLDILLRHQVTGELKASYLNGTSKIGEGALPTINNNLEVFV